MKDKKNKIIVILGVLFMCCVVTTGLLIKDNIDSKTYFKINNKRIQKGEYDFYYQTNYLSFLKSHKSELSKIGLDPNKDLSEQRSIDNKNSWQMYFQKNTIELLKQVIAINELAKENGFASDKEKLYKNYIQELTDEANNEKETIEKVIRDKHGKKATIEDVKKYAVDYLVANAYIENLKSKKSFTNSQYEDFYEKHKDLIDKVDFRDYMVENHELADKIFEKITDEKSYIKTVAENATEEKELLKKDESTLLTGVSKKDIDKSVAKWLYNPERKTGDIAIVKEDGKDVYHILLFKKRYRDDTRPVDLRIIFLNNENAGKADEIYDKLKGKTEKDFIESVEKYTTIEKDKRNKGLYRNFPKNYLTKEFDIWAFDKSREQGDITKINYDSGAVIAYFVKKGNNELWKTNEKTYLSDEYVNKLIKENIDKYKLNDLHKIFSFK